MIRAGALLGTAALLASGCTTVAADPVTERPAALSSADDPALRESIRLHVRDTLGDDYIANLDKLTTVGLVMATDRGRRAVTGKSMILEPVMFYVFQRSSSAGDQCVLDTPDRDYPSLDLPTELCVTLEADVIR